MGDWFERLGERGTGLRGWVSGIWLERLGEWGWFERLGE